MRPVGKCHVGILNAGRFESDQFAPNLQGEAHTEGTVSAAIAPEEGAVTSCRLRPGHRRLHDFHLRFG